MVWVHGWGRHLRFRSSGAGFAEREALEPFQLGLFDVLV